ncbi:hypothetical protein [Metabacillus iocasae]|uniref:Uncharacterized protein YecA (UPF0149 family) n=1 Tax=Priestia iocasae TaxID=2291674 RepID=A0ABS2QPG3_9BACI|nr:hypothetical protein [Metabacillus iocasae]MBM7701213.1 uncharacterized protein YecA (UPF0149 family) [Metabacillus iocasae]
MKSIFKMDERLGISLPRLQKEWEDYTKEEQQAILLKWEEIRGTIPDRIYELETIINEKQAQLGEESNFERSCQLNHDISELASIINDLWIWYRLNQHVSKAIHT